MGVTIQTDSLQHEHKNCLAIRLCLRRFRASVSPRRRSSRDKSEERRSSVLWSPRSICSSPSCQGQSWTRLHLRQDRRSRQLQVGRQTQGWSSVRTLIDFGKLDRLSTSFKLNLLYTF